MYINLGRYNLNSTTTSCCLLIDQRWLWGYNEGKEIKIETKIMSGKNKIFLIILGDTSELNKILIKSIKQTFQDRNVLDHLVENLAEGNAVAIYRQTKEHLKNSTFILMPNLDKNIFYEKFARPNNLAIKELTDVSSFDELMNERTNEFL